MGLSGSRDIKYFFISDCPPNFCKAYRHRSSYALTHDRFDTDEFEYSSPTNMIGAVALVLSVSLVVVVVLMYRRLRTL